MTTSAAPTRITPGLHGGPHQGGRRRGDRPLSASTRRRRGPGRREPWALRPGGRRARRRVRHLAVESQLVHGGLRYLASGQVGLAHESAVERHTLLSVTAPHLTRALPMLLPWQEGTTRGSAAMVRAGLAAGDLLAWRRAPVPLPAAPSRRGRPEAAPLAPALRKGDLRGGVLGGTASSSTTPGWCLCRPHRGVAARTSAPGPRPASATRASVRALLDELHGVDPASAARTVVNATGVWAGDLVDEVTLRPTRGTHLVLRGRRPRPQVALFAPVPGETNRFCCSCPSPTARCASASPTSPSPGPPRRARAHRARSASCSSRLGGVQRPLTARRRRLLRRPASAAGPGPADRGPLDEPPTSRGGAPSSPPGLAWSPSWAAS